MSGGGGGGGFGGMESMGNMGGFGGRDMAPVGRMGGNTVFSVHCVEKLGYLCVTSN